MYEMQIGVTPEQKQTIREVQAALGREVKNLLPDPQNPPPPPAPRGRRTFPNVWDKIREREAEASGRINAVLKSDQREKAQKLAQEILIYLRLDIPPQTLDSLSLSDLQKEQLAKIAQTTTLRNDVEFEQAVQNNDAQAMRRIATARRESALEQTRAILNDAQRIVISEWYKSRKQ
jgi:hypothetical protein